MSSKNSNWYLEFGKKFTKARVQVVEPRKAVDDDGDEEGGTMTGYDTSRGPYFGILDKLARAQQAATCESYEKSFAKVYTDPRNAALKDADAFEQLAKAHDRAHGTRLRACLKRVLHAGWLYDSRHHLQLMR